MNLVLYSDSNYEYQIKNFIDGLSYGGVKHFRLFYYNIGFRSSIQHPNVIRIPWERNTSLPRFEYYKPAICLDLLNYVKDQIVFLDSDILLSKRFSSMPFSFGKECVGCCTAPMNYPNTYWEDARGRTYFDEKKYMQYMGVSERSMDYIMTCFFTYDSQAADFLEEWKSFCENTYLLKKEQSFFPFKDETIANVLMWKRGFNFNYGRSFINTHKFSTFKLCEENDNIENCLIDNNPYEQCERSSMVRFYHGVKVVDENVKILNFINENS
ncbi:MAG: hypothetical protein ABFD07_19600 [Methanobacterium sp.]